MSNLQFPEAQLRRNAHGPVFEGLERIHQLLYCGDPSRINEVFTSHVRLKLPKHGSKVERVTMTSDNYLWMLDIPFSRYGRRFHILLPATLDYQKSDGTCSERHMALYYRGRPLEREQLLEVTGMIETVMVKEFLDLYFKAMTDEQQAIVAECLRH